MAGFIYTGYFFFGACLMAIFNKVVAHVVGRLSPNFLAVCEPNYTEGALVFTRHICTGMLVGRWWIVILTRSFDLMVFDTATKEQ